MQSLSSANTAIWPAEKRPVLDWLMLETSGERFVDNVLVEMCNRLVADGVPIARCSLHIRILHPQWLGARILWKKGMAEAQVTTFDHPVQGTSQIPNSPTSEIDVSAGEVRQRLAATPDGDYEYPIYNELSEEGYTDYLGWPIAYTLGKTHVVTFASDQTGGFSDWHIAYLKDLLPALALVSEIRIKNRLARTLLETYVGPRASEQILAGATTRGSGATVGAAILISDLRDFTAISDSMPRDDVIALLNDYFDAICTPIERHGGEVLKFIGDGLMAIFPLSNPDACASLLAAISEAQLAMNALCDSSVARRRKSLGYGVGVHVGDVMYGNIGSRTRLDFTVIGPAVNIASRIEDLTKAVKRPILFSKAFVEAAGCETRMENLGFFRLKGLGEPVEILALPNLARSTSRSDSGP